MKTSIIAAAIVGALVIIPTSTAFAAPTTLKVYDQTHDDMIAGTGNPIDNFTQSTGADTSDIGNTVTVSLKARNRDTGEPTSQLGPFYHVDPGTNFSFDYQFDPGTDSDTDFYLKLMVDFDPSLGTNFATIDSAISGYWHSSDGYFETNQGGHSDTAWNDSTVPYVISNSENLSFGFWQDILTAEHGSGEAYDPNASGNYEIDLSAYGSDGTTLLATTKIFALVGPNAPVPVPEPAVLGMFGVGLLGLGFAVAYKRRCAGEAESEA